MTVTLPQEPKEFAEFWEAYPPRQGSRDRKAAVKAFRAALKRATFAEILAGAKSYYIDILSKNKLNTEFVKQARTWLNADGWKEVLMAPIATIAPLPTESREDYIRNIRMRRG